MIVCPNLHFEDLIADCMKCHNCRNSHFQLPEFHFEPNQMSCNQFWHCYTLHLIDKADFSLMQAIRSF